MTYLLPTENPGVPAANDRDSVMAYTGYQVHGLGWQQDAEGRIVRYLYDAQGRPTSVTIVRKDGLLDIFETQYDDFERTSTQIDPLQRKTITWFDIQGNPTKVQRQLDSTGKVVTTLAKYDNLGNLVWSQAPGGDTSHYEYTLANELRYSTNSDHFQTWSKYDWTGSPIRTSRRGVGSGGYGVGGDSSSMSYDGLGRLLSVSVDDNARMGQHLIYDAQGGITDPGMLLGVSRGTGAASGMRYDLRGNMTTRMLTAGIFEGAQSSQNPTDSLQWEYLPDGRPKLQRLPRGARIEYQWDVLDRLGKVRFIDPKGVTHGVVDTFLYRKTGSLDSIRLANGIGEKFGYDSTRGMLTTQRVSSGTHTLGLRRDDYDHAARLQQRTRMDGQETYYGYDNLDRLSTVRYGLGKSNGKSNLSYSWSDNGNMTNLVHDYGQTQWTLGSATGEVATSVGTEDGVSKWGYDWAGRLGNRKWTATSAVTDTLTRESRQYSWNASSELERFARTESVASGSASRDVFGFAYGDHGLRVGKYRGTVTGTDTAWKLARRSVWDGSDVVADSTAGDSAWHYRIVLGLNAVAEARRDSGNVWHLTYVVSDPVGTPELLLDDSGKVVASYAHDAFGNLEDYQGSRETDFRFGGREWDPDLQAGVFGYRLLDPVMGGFLSTDPMEQFNNNYSYVGGNPLDGVDPWGLYSGEDATSTTNPGTCEEGTTLVRGNVPKTNTEVGRLTPDWDRPIPQGPALTNANPTQYAPDQTWRLGDGLSRVFTRPNIQKGLDVAGKYNTAASDVVAITIIIAAKSNTRGMLTLAAISKGLDFSQLGIDAGRFYLDRGNSEKRFDMVKSLVALPLGSTVEKYMEYRFGKVVNHNGVLLYKGSAASKGDVRSAVVGAAKKASMVSLFYNEYEKLGVLYSLMPYLAINGGK